MCLVSLIENEVVPEKGIGYKVFQLYKKSDKFVYRFPFFSHLRHLSDGDTIENTHRTVLDLNPFFGSNKTYISGFHVFLELEDAIQYSTNLINAVVVKVLFEKGRVLGMQTVDRSWDVPSYPAKCVVADKITLLERAYVLPRLS